MQGHTWRGTMLSGGWPFCRMRLSARPTLPGYGQPRHLLRRSGRRSPMPISARANAGPWRTQRGSRRGNGSGSRGPGWRRQRRAAGNCAPAPGRASAGSQRRKRALRVSATGSRRAAGLCWRWRERQARKRRALSSPSRATGWRARLRRTFWRRWRRAAGIAGRSGAACALPLGSLSRTAASMARPSGRHGTGGAARQRRRASGGEAMKARRRKRRGLAFRCAPSSAGGRQREQVAECQRAGVAECQRARVAECQRRAWRNASRASATVYLEQGRGVAFAACIPPRYRRCSRCARCVGASEFQKRENDD